MKHHQHITSAQVGPTFGEISTWPLALRLLHQRVASYFARPEPRRHALLYLQAILSELPRKKKRSSNGHVFVICVGRRSMRK